MSEGQATVGASEASPSPVILITDYEQEFARFHETQETFDHTSQDDHDATVQETDATPGSNVSLHLGDASDVFRDLESRYSDQHVSQAELFAPDDLTTPSVSSIVDFNGEIAITSADDSEPVRDPTVPLIIVVSPEEGEAMLEAQAKPALKKAIPLSRNAHFLESVESRPRARRRSMSMVPERLSKAEPSTAPTTTAITKPDRISQVWVGKDTTPDGGWKMRTRVTGPSESSVSSDIVVVYLYNSTNIRHQNADLEVFEHTSNVKQGHEHAAPPSLVRRARTDLEKQSQHVVNGDDSRKMSTDHQVHAINWLQDQDMLRKHMPDSRIIAVGFDITNTVSAVPNYEIPAGQLLAHLQDLRKHNTTPIILAGHALASLIVVQALALTSLRGSRAANVLAQTAGAFLFSCSIRCPLSRARQLADLYGAKSTDKLFSDRSGSPAMERLSQLAKKGLFSSLHRDRGLNEGPPSKRPSPPNDIQILIGYPVTQFFTEDDDQRTDSLALTTFLGASVRPVMLSKRLDSAMRFTGRDDPDFLRLMLLMKSSLQTFQLLYSAAVGDIGGLNKLVESGANPNLRDRWGQTALQVAARMEHEDLVHAILRFEGIEIDVRDKKSNTPLHHAVRTGNENIVRTLLHHGADVNIENSRKRTPRDLAEKHRSRMHIAKLLKNRLVDGPDQSLRSQRLGLGKRPDSVDGQMACKNYQITVTEVYTAHTSDKHWSVKLSVDAFLYGKSTLRDILHQLRPKEVKGKSPICTWIHVPENNMIWIEDLFAKLKLHPAIWQETQGFITDSLRNRAITPHVGANEIRSVFFPFLSYELSQRQEKRMEFVEAVYEEHLRQREVTADILPENTPPTGKRLSRDFVGHEVLPLPDSMNLESYPYLEEDSDSDFSDHEGGNDDDLPAEEKALIRTYLHDPPALHIRRTLDKFYYHMLETTKDRDQDQVVSRWSRKIKNKARHNVIMVDQLWLYGATQNHPSNADQSESYVISCFPSRTGTGDGYHRSLDDLRHLVLDPSHRRRSPITWPGDLMSRVLETCCGVFDRMQNAEMLRFFQMFDDSVGSIDDQESRLFQNFQRGSTRLLELSPINKYYDEQKHTLLVDLLDIREEIKLLVEIKDIRDEINIILTVLGIQRTLLEQMRVQGNFSTVFGRGLTAAKLVQLDINDFTRMDSQARTIQEKLNTLMDLKQKAANAWEARESRETTVAASKQGNTVLVFTVVTIVFLPLSFMSSFFAIGIAAFPKDASTGQTNWPLGIVTGLLFGMSLSLSIPLIIFALNMESCSAMYKELRYNHFTRIGINIIYLLPFLAALDTPGSYRKRWTEQLRRSHENYANQPSPEDHAQAVASSVELSGIAKHSSSTRSTGSSYTMVDKQINSNQSPARGSQKKSSNRRRYVL